MAEPTELTREEVSRAYREAFATRSGQIAITDLTQRFGFVTQTTLVAGDSHCSAFNEGNRAVIAYINMVITGGVAPSGQEETIEW